MNYKGSIKKREDGKRIYGTYIYPEVPKDDRDIYLLSQSGDRLDILAYKYYGDVKYWKLLAVANHLGKGSLIIPPGIQIRIPFDKEIVN